MTHTIRRWLVTAALTAVVAPCTGAADPPPVPAPAPPPAYVLPPVNEPLVPAFIRPDPLLERPEAPMPGPFFNVETTVDFVHLRNQPSIPVVISPTQTDVIRFPGNRLDDTVTPRFEIGYRLPDGLGDFRLSYRFLVTSGNNDFTNADLGPVSQHGRLDLNVLDLLYTTREYSLDPHWAMWWWVGVRYSYLYFDSRVNVLNPGTDVGSVLAQSESNSVWGLGPMFGLEVDRKTSVPGLALFFRDDISGMWARIKQVGTEDVVPGAGVTGFNLSRIQTSLGVPTFDFTVGLSYTIPEWNQSRLMIGYHYEVWWQIGRLNDSRGTLEEQGLFLRAEFNF
jgi:hypothetical protein